MAHFKFHDTAAFCSCSCSFYLELANAVDDEDEKKSLTLQGDFAYHWPVWSCAGGNVHWAVAQADEVGRI